MGHQPSAHFATRLSAFLSRLPIRTGGPGCCTGLGLQRTGLNFTYLPSNDASSLDHSSRIAAIHSAVCVHRLGKSTPSSSDSSRNHPAPIPNRNLPFENASRVATSLAVTIALRSGTRQIHVTTLRWVVTAAAMLSATNGSHI